jgi:hypothetical protein
MGGFVWGCILGAVVVYSTVGERVEVQEVLPENYAIVTSVSDTMCSGPTGKANVVTTRTRTQTVQLQ